MDLPNLPPLFVYGAILVGFVITNLLLAHLLGPRKHTPVKDMPYESGMDPVGDARQPFDVRFYLVAILFFSSSTSSCCFCILGLSAPIVIWEFRQNCGTPCLE